MLTYPIVKHLTKINKGKKGDNKPEFIVFHYLGATGQAEANARYFEKEYRGASAHYFVDQKTIIQVVEDDTPAWHVGDAQRTNKGTLNGYIKKGGATNTNTIGIEVCLDVTTGKTVYEMDFHEETLKRVEWLIRKLQKEHNISDDRVIRHFDASGKNCPGNWSRNNWAKWWEFKERLHKDIKQPSPTGNNNPEGKVYDDDMYVVQVGDSLSKIAKRFGVTLEWLVEHNGIEDPNLIYPETKLRVVAGAPVHKPTPAPKPEDKTALINRLADEVLKGKHGSGRERMISLGVNYALVQAEVNRRLRKK